MNPSPASDIDIVYTWVDGNDPRLNALRSRYAGTPASGMSDDTGGTTRYANLGELAWSVASVNRFIPWARRIFIVTDGQDPMPLLEPVLRQFSHPVPVEVVDHRTIFRGCEELLPVFNSISIETMLWRIPGLSDRYIYFNDDTFVMAPMQPSDWFDGERLILHGHRMPLWWASLLDRLRMRGGRNVIGFKTAMIAAARQLGTGHLLYYYHTPTAQSRRLLEEYFAAHPGVAERNAAPKFRERTQFTPHSLCNLLAERAGRLRIEHSDINLFLKPVASRPDYLTVRLSRADRRADLRLGCISSLDKASPAQQKEFEQWISRRLQISL